MIEAPNWEVFDPLQNLEGFLESQGLPSRRTIHSSETIRSFLENFLFFSENYDWGIETLGLSCQLGGYAVHVNLDALVKESPFTSLEQSVAVNEISRGFTDWVALPLLPNPNTHFWFYEPEIVNDLSFEELLREKYKKKNEYFCGLLKNGSSFYY